MMKKIRYVIFAAILGMLGGCATTSGMTAFQAESGDAVTVFKSPPEEMQESNYRGGN
jgi:hypothetical protein